MHKSNTFSVTPPPPPPNQIALGICLVHVLKYCSYYVSEHEAWEDKIFKRFVNLRTDYQKLQHQRDPSQPLTACQQWKLTDLSYLKTFYKQGHKASRRGTWPREQLELEERDAYQNSCSPRSHAHKKM